MAEYVGAIDQGTTGTRFLVFDRDGRAVAGAYETHEQHYPKPGWVEHDAGEILRNVETVVERALAEAGLTGDDLAAVGVANQRETTVLWDAATGDPLARAVVWQDRRTTDRVEELAADGLTDGIRATTGLEPDAYFSATKAEWLLDHAGDRGAGDAVDAGRGADGTDATDGADGADAADGAGGGDGADGTGDDGRGQDLRELAAAGEVRLGTVDAFLLDRLTDEHVTDVTNAARTMLFDVRELDWDDDLLAEFGVPRAALPEVRPSSAVYGHTDPDGPFGAAVPVAAALGDQQAALFGQACFDPGDVKSTTGTGSFVLMNTGTDPVESDHGLLTTVAYQREGARPRYALEGSIFVTGAAVEWLVDVGVLADAADSERLARAVDSTDGVYVVPAFQGLGAPHWDGRARGTVVGLTRSTGREHLARATLEAVAFRTRDVVEAMAADAGVAPSTLRVDGGAVENDLLCQFTADAVGTPVDRPVERETTALGAAFAAGLAVGVWDDPDELRARRRADRVFEPEPERAEADRRYGRWREAVERSKGWAREE